MKAVISTALLGLAFGAQDDELWSLFPKVDPTTTPVVTDALPVLENTQTMANNAVKLTPPATYGTRPYLFKKPDFLTLDDNNDELWSLFPKADPVIADPIPVIENTQTAANNAVKLTRPATYSARPYLFKKPDFLTFDDNNDELWSLFPQSQPPAPPTTSDDTKVVDDNKNEGNKAVKLTPPATYTARPYLFKKPDFLTFDDDNEFFSQTNTAQPQRESRFFGNLARFVTKIRQPHGTAQFMADDEFMNLNALLNDAVKTYNDVRQSKPNIGQLVNDGIQIVKDIKKHDDEEEGNELFELAQLIKEAQSAKPKKFLRQAKSTQNKELCFELHGVRHCLDQPDN